MFHKPDPNNLKPCPHMQTLVSAWTDGRLKGLALWYTKKHVEGCRQCQSSLPFLQSLQSRLSTLGKTPSQQKLTDKQWEAVEKAWVVAEQETHTDGG